MFRQKQTPRDNNPSKKCSANAKQKPQENTHTEEWSKQSCICNSIEITHPHWPSPANRLHPHKILSQKNISGRLLLYRYLISKLDFVKRNLLKVKTHETIDILWLPYDWLWLLKTFIYIIWQNFLVREKKISLYSWYTWINSKIWFTGIRS